MPVKRKLLAVISNSVVETAKNGPAIADMQNPHQSRNVCYASLAHTSTTSHQFICFSIRSPSDISMNFVGQLQILFCIDIILTLTWFQQN